MTINQFLIKKLSISKTDAISLIASKCILINKSLAIQKQIIADTDQILHNGIELQTPSKHHYVIFYKPRGVECTLNESIENNLTSVFNFHTRLFPVGRLDKDSEGLLLLTNDGHLYNDIASGSAFKEKEYEVTVNKYISEEDLLKLAEGIIIKGILTRKAVVERISPVEFRIILTEGINRQIRRMCYKLDYEVTRLKRVRIMAIGIGDIKLGQFREIEREDIYGKLEAPD